MTQRQVKLYRGRAFQVSFEHVPKCLKRLVYYTVFAAGCQSQEYLNYTWPVTGVGAIASAPCPCAEILGVFAGEVTRQCMPSLHGAKWSAEINLSNCETVLSQVTQQLCDMAMVTIQIERLLLILCTK